MYQNVSSKRMENQLGTMDLNDADFAFALQLQEQFNREDGFPLVADLNHLRRTNNTDHVLALQLQEELNKETAKSTFTNGTIKTSIVDKFWELNDPNPDIRGLFLEFNASYFWNKLQPVEVRWSNRMTLCAGLCCYEGRGGLCSIRLSLPLLKLRPRKDLVETLLHEMIHAYLFVTHNNRDHNAHGPEFIKHMHRINKLTGANITIYHNFHDEVNEYRQHWWRCNGPCQHRPPYYGIVRRAMNRAPSANDFWWEEHKMTCGGTYEKIKEPEENSTKRKQIETTTGIRKKAKNENMNIKTFFLPSDENQFGNDQFFHNRIKETSNNSGSSFTNMNSSKNIHTFSKVPKSSQIMPFSGKGYILGSSSLLNSNSAHKKGTLLSYFESNENTCDKHSSSSKETKFGNKKGPELTPLKKHIQSTMKSYASKLNTTLSPDNQTPTKFHGIWPKVTNTSQYLKEKGSRKKLLPPGKLSTASPLNHVRKIFMVNDNNTDCSSENLHIKTLPDMATAKQYVKKELSINNISSLETHILNSASDKLTVTCPVCNQEIQNIHINSHLDQCLSG